MKMNTLLGRHAFKKSLVLTITLVACPALQANEEDKQPAGKEYHADKDAKDSKDTKGGPVTAEKFLQKTLASGQMEAQMGRLGEQQAQNAQVKALAAAMAKDHTAVNQKLQQLASAKNVTQDRLDQAKHREHVEKLKGQSGAEFDKEFVRMALKHHKKDIAAFEKAQSQLNDPELKRFVSETLPTLREHYRMAQAAAGAVGVDEASIAAEIEADADTAAGAAAGAASGTLEKNDLSPDRPRSSFDGATDTDASGTINQNDPSFTEPGRFEDRDLSADVDTDDGIVEADVDTDDNKIFQKGDGKVLGLSTDKNDGKFLGIIPNPGADNDDTDAGVTTEVDVDTGEAVGGAASVESGGSDKDQ